jgi:Ser/Thr protein kinase RdoA (MazF antagonist)
VLDFDAAVHGWYGLDVAIAVGDASGEQVAWFLAGYAEVRRPPTGVREALPRLLGLVTAVKVAGLLQAYATTDDASSPGWVTAMRDRHRRWLGARRAELAATWSESR